jgi:hypothetical protein
MVFFEKKKKTFIPFSEMLGISPRQRTKVFCFFFSKKKAFLPCRRQRLSPPRRPLCLIGEATMLETS